MAEVALPALVLASPRGGGRFAWVAREPRELGQASLHEVWRGRVRDVRIVDAEGRVFMASDVRVAGLDGWTIGRIGWGASLLSALVSGFDVPVRLAWTLAPAGMMDVDAARAALRECVATFPRCYARTRTRASVERRLARARSIPALVDAIG